MASVTSSTLSSISEVSTVLSDIKSEQPLTTLMIVLNLKSFTSAVISTYSGIVTSSVKSLSVTCKLSFNPGRAVPTTMLLFPLDMTFPLVTLMFVKSSFNTIPEITMNGT